LSQSSLFTRFYRLSRIFIHTLAGLMIATFVLPFLRNNTKLSLIRWWCGGLLRAFGIQVSAHGELPASNTQGTMFIANHISWVDIHALNSLIPLRFIAKSEIKNWPIFGYLVSQANTLFIDRSKRQEAGRIVEITAESLKSGDNLCFFPEGTTSDGAGFNGAGLEGARILPFKGSILQAAVDANTHIWPVAIHYPAQNGVANIAMAYAGDTTLIESMRNILRQAEPKVALHFLPRMDASNQDRRDLTQAAFDAINTKLVSVHSRAGRDSPA
jgi:1-acyl-sn-glycerol-3-phosphate acyltransferase